MAPATRLYAAGFRAVAYAAGPAVIILLAMTYLFSPEFYLAWVIEPQGREYQIVEISTFVAAFSATILLTIWIGHRYWSGGGRGHHTGIMVVGLIALATFFFAGEEISWGQTYLGWETPEEYRGFSHETNLHNTTLPVQSLGGVFLIVMFFVLPLAWWFDRRLWARMPPGMGPAIPEGPVVACVATGFLWQETKNLYRFLHDDYAERATYIEFFEQINEHKELVFAVALLLYAIFRFRYRAEA